MTTAHRPTWAPAVGGEEQGGLRIFVPSRAVSAKNLPGHLKLKFRQDGQSSVDELQKKDLRAELEAKERKHFQEKKGINFEEERKKDLLLLESAPSEGPSKQLVPKNIDADDEDPSGSSSSSDDDDDDDDDDEEELLKLELERIKKERAEEAARKAREEAERSAKDKERELAAGNPLLGNVTGAGGDAPNFNIKRRWDEDVVFKNQARGEPKAQKRFINDTIRNDFHRRFLERYMR